MKEKEKVITFNKPWLHVQW